MLFLESQWDLVTGYWPVKFAIILNTKWIYGHILTPSFFCCLSFCSLSNKKIKDKGACALSAALQVNQSLQELKWVQPFMSYILWGVHWYFSDGYIWTPPISQLVWESRIVAVQYSFSGLRLVKAYSNLIFARFLLYPLYFEQVLKMKYMF